MDSPLFNREEFFLMNQTTTEDIMAICRKTVIIHLLANQAVKAIIRAKNKERKSHAK